MSGGHREKVEHRTAKVRQKGKRKQARQQLAAGPRIRKRRHPVPTESATP